MEFYNDLIIQKSWQLLQDFRRNFKFILIGGWAVFLYTKALKSKDIDIIVEYSELERLKENFNLTKNDRLKKYEIRQEEFDIDIYLPHYSNLGLPIEDVAKYGIEREGFIAPKIEILLIMKQFVFGERQGSPKGEKDRLDILSLLKSSEIDWDFYKELLEQYGFGEFRKELINLLKETKQAPELGLNEYLAAKLRRGISSQLN